jgi:hypothetical protein
MVYTEIKEINRRRYFYRVKSIRNGKKFKKERIYLGKNLSKEALLIKEGQANKKLSRDKINKTLLKIKPKIIKVLKKYNIKKAGIFGSFISGKQKKNSDIDILIEPPRGIGFGFVGIQLELENKLGRKVDLVTYKYLSPYLKDKILSQEVRII